MAVISWGKPSIGVYKYPSTTTEYEVNSGVTFKKVDYPANGTTSIETSEGEKHEAQIEGGQLEAVKYDSDTYQLVFEIRKAAGRSVIANDKDGVINGTFAFVVQPEDPTSAGVMIEAATLKKSTSYSSADGLTDRYVADVVLPKSGNSIKYGPVSFGSGVESSGVVTSGSLPDSFVSADSIAVGSGANAIIYTQVGSYTD